MPHHAERYATVAEAIRFIRRHARTQPTLAEIAAAVGLSEFHLQRIFTEWAGISPKRFLQFLNKEHALHALRKSTDVLAASIDAGLSSPGRLHDLIVSCEAMTPGNIRTFGAGLCIGYGDLDTPFGQALIGWTDRGICHLQFAPAEIDTLRSAYPLATFLPDPSRAQELGRTIFSGSPQPGKLHLLLRGTNFQIKVWEALLRIPAGQVVSYSQLGRLAGAPRAQRAVGSALAANAIAYLIPCHRVIRESGEIGHYRWDNERKQALIAWEAAQADAT